MRRMLSASRGQLCRLLLLAQKSAGAFASDLFCPRFLLVVQGAADIRHGSRPRPVVRAAQIAVATQHGDLHICLSKRGANFFQLFRGDTVHIRNPPNGFGHGKLSSVITLVCQRACQFLRGKAAVIVGAASVFHAKILLFQECPPAEPEGIFS